MESHFSGNLTFLRKTQGLTLTQVAEVVEKDITTINKWREGETDPGIEDILKLAAAFEVSTDDLLTRDLKNIIPYTKKGREIYKQNLSGNVKDTLEEILKSSRRVIESKEEIITAMEATIAYQQTIINMLNQQLERAGKK